MRDNDAAFAVTMRMRVLFGRTAMCRPARMTEAEFAGQRLLDKELLEVLQLAGCAPDSQFLIFNDGDARRIILNSATDVAKRKSAVALANVFF